MYKKTYMYSFLVYMHINTDIYVFTHTQNHTPFIFYISHLCTFTSVCPREA